MRLVDCVICLLNLSKQLSRDVNEMSKYINQVKKDCNTYLDNVIKNFWFY